MAYRSLRVRGLVILGLLWQLCAAAQPGSPREWDGLSLPELAALARQLRPPEVQDLADPEAFSRLTDHVAARFAASAGQKLDWKPWLVLIDVTGDRVPQAVRQQMVLRVRKELVPDEPAILRHDPDSLSRVCVALVRLGERGRASEVVSTWVNGSEQYKTA